MILINLLPHREEKRKRRRQAFFSALGLAALGGVLIVALWYGLLQQMIASQQQRNDFLQSEIRKLEDQIKDIANLRAEIEALKARQKAVEDLQTDRNVPVHLLNELVRHTPEGIYLTQIKQEGQTVTVSGIAQTNERVSEFLRNTAYRSTWLERPELLEIKLPKEESRVNSRQPRQREVKRLFEFSMKVSLKRPQSAEGADGAASAPAPAPAAAAPKQS